MSHLFFPFYDVVVGLYTDITLLDCSVYGPEYVPVLYFPTPCHISTDLLSLPHASLAPSFQNFESNLCGTVICTVNTGTF